MPINLDDYDLIEEGEFDQSEYPQRNFEQSPYTPPTPGRFQPPAPIDKPFSYAPLPEGWQAPSDQVDPIQRENEMRAAYGDPGKEMTTAMARSTGLFPEPKSPEQIALEARIAASEKAAGVEEIPTRLKVATAMSSAFSKAAGFPEKLAETLNDITGWSRVLDATSGGLDIGNQSRTEAALKRMVEDEQRMSAADAQVHGGTLPYQLIEATTRGLAELPFQALPAARAKNVQQAIKIAAGTAGLMQGTQTYVQERGSGREMSRALPRAALSGVITAATTKAFGATGAESIFRRDGIKGAMAKVKDALVQGGHEFPEELIDQVGQDILERIDNNPDKPVEDSFKEALMAGLTGFFVGGIATGARNAMPSGSTQVPNSTSDFRGRINLNAAPPSVQNLSEEFHQLQQMEKSGKLDQESAQRLEDLKTVSESGMTIEDLDYLEQERQGMRLESNITTGSNPDDPFTGRVMQANFNTGKVEINPYEMAAQMNGMNPEQRRAYIKSALSEEKIHLSTPQEAADKFIKNATGVEKFLAGWRYTGNVSGKPAAGAEISERNLGHEMLRSQIQRMQGITRTELAANVKSGKLTTKILLATEDAIFDIRKALGTSASKEQRAALDQVEKNVKEGLRIASGAEGDDEGPATLRIPGNATEEVNTFIQEFMKPDGKIASRSDDPSVATAIKTGLALKSTADLDALLSLNNKARGRLQELRDKRKSQQPLTPEETKEMFHLMGRVQFPREAVEAATNTGGWVEGTAGNNYGPRPLSQSENPGVRKWLEQHGAEMGISLPEESPAAIRRGGPSKRGQEIAEQKRRIAEMQAKARGEELPTELQTPSAEPAGTPVPAEDRAAPETWGFITPTPAQISENANEVLSGEVKVLPAAERKKSTEGMTPEEKAELKQPSAKYDRPTFQKFVESFTGKGQRAIAPSKLREAWEDSVWANILTAPSQRLESLRKALGLEKNYGSSTISDPTPATPEPRAKYRAEKSAEEAGAAEKDWRRSAATRMTDASKRESARRRYRLTLTRAIAMKLIEEANEGRPSLDRSEVGVDDIDFDNAETAHSAYQAINRQDLADPKRLKSILRDGARGSMNDPESASHRLVAVSSASGEVYLLSTYNDAGVQRVVSPTGTGMRHRPHEVLDAAFLKRYRPFASILLNDPIRAFKQKYKTMSEFNDQIGREAAERARVGDWEIVPEGPAPDEFTAEGTPGLEGEGGSFMGPGRDIVAPSAGGRSLQSEGKVTDNELSSMLDHIMDEVGEFQSPGDVEHSLEALVFEAERGKLSNHSLRVVNGYRKVFDAIEATNPNLSREEIVDRMAESIYATYQSSENAAEFVKKSMAQFAPQSARPAGPQPETVARPVSPQRGGKLPYSYVPEAESAPTPDTDETFREAASRGRLINRRTEAVLKYKPLAEMSPAEADRRAKSDAEAAGFKQLADQRRRQGIQTTRQRTLRKQGILPTYEQAQQIYDENFPEQGTMPAAIRRGEMGPADKISRDRILGEVSAMFGGNLQKRQVEALVENPNTELAVRQIFQEAFPPSHWGNVAQDSGSTPEEAYNSALGRGIDVVRQAKLVMRSQSGGEGPAAIRRRVGPTITNLLREFGSIYDSWMVDRIERHGGAVAAEAAEGFRRIIDRQRKLYGDLTPSLDTAKRLAGGNRVPKVAAPSTNPIERAKQIISKYEPIKVSPKGLMAMNWLNKPEPYKEAPFVAATRVVGAMEGTLKGVPVGASDIIIPAKVSNLEVGRLWMRAIPSFRAGGFFQRNVNSLGYDVILRGPTMTKSGQPSPPAGMWEKWTAGTARINHIPISKVRTDFREWKAKLNDPGVDAATIERFNQDFSRKYPKVVTHIKHDGRWQAVVHSDLFGYLENAAQRASHAAAFREVFPNTVAGKQKLEKLTTKLRAELPAEHQKDLQAMILSMQGHPTDDYTDREVLGPTQFGGSILRLFNQTVGNLLAKMVLSGQIFVQPGEVIAGATPVFLGYKRYLKAMAELNQLYPQMERDGKVSRVIYDFTVDRKHLARSASRSAGNAMSKAFMEQALNELQEGLAAATATVTARDIESGNLSDWDKRMLPETFKAMGFNTDEVMGLMQGDPELLGQFQRKAASFLTSGNKAISEGSRLGANRLFNSIFRFQQYPMMKMNQFRRLAVSMSEAWLEGGTPYQKRTSSEMMARYLFGGASQGVLTVGITALAYAGAMGLKIKWEELKDEPVEFLTDAFLQTQSGPFYLVWRGLKNKGISGVGENMTRMAFPYTTATELIDFAQGAGKYRDTDAFTKIGKFISAKMPGTKAISTGMALFGLSQNDQKLDASIDGFYRWRREELGFSEHKNFGMEDVRKEFRTKMKRAVEALKDGKADEFYEAYQEAADELLTMEKGTTLKEAFNNAKILTGASGAKLTDEQAESLRERIGEDAYNRLEYFDLMLEEAGDGVLLPKYDE